MLYQDPPYLSDRSWKSKGVSREAILVGLAQERGRVAKKGNLNPCGKDPLLVEKTRVPGKVYSRCKGGRHFVLKKKAGSI